MWAGTSQRVSSCRQERVNAFSFMCAGTSQVFLCVWGLFFSCWQVRIIMFSPCGLVRVNVSFPMWACVRVNVSFPWRQVRAYAFFHMGVNVFFPLWSGTNQRAFLRAAGTTHVFFDLHVGRYRSACFSPFGQVRVSVFFPVGMYESVCFPSVGRY